MSRRRADPAADELRDPHAAVLDARNWAGPGCCVSVAQAWRWHCEAWPRDAVSLTTWRRYWHELADADSRR